MAEVNVNNIFVGAPDQLTTGAVSDAPVGTKLPTQAGDKLDNAFRSSGYISEEGLSLATDKSTSDIKDWSGQSVRKVLESFEGTISYEELEMSEDACRHAFGEDSVEVTGANGEHGNQLKISIGAQLPPVQSWVYRMKDNKRKMLVVVPRGQVTNGVEMTFKRGEAIKLPIEISCLDDGTGHSIYIFTDDGQVVAK